MTTPAHSTCQALNKRKWSWRSAKATWLWLGARSMLKLFKNWFTITNTNNMRREKISKISKIYFLVFYVCGLAASPSENYANICDTVSGRYVNIFQLHVQHFFTACNHSSKSWKVSLTDFLFWHWFCFRNSLVIKAAAAELHIIRVII